MGKWTVKTGTKVFIQDKGEYITKKDIVLSYEVVKPLAQFPREVLVASVAIKENKFCRLTKTRLFVATKEVWPKYPNQIIAVHEENLHEYKD